MSNAEQLGLFTEQPEHTPTEAVDLSLLATHIGAHALRRDYEELGGVWEEVVGGLPATSVPAEAPRPTTNQGRNRPPRLPEFIPTGEPRFVDEDTKLRNLDAVKEAKGHISVSDEEPAPPIPHVLRNWGYRSGRKPRP